MTRVATADNEDYLLMIAKHGTAWHMEMLVSKYRRAARNIEADLAMAQQRQRDCDWYFDDDGSLVVRARLPVDQGQLLLKAIDHAMERRFRDASPDPAAEKRRPPIALQRADALAEVAETYLANDDAVSTTADRFQVIVHAAAETLQAADNDPSVSAETPLLDPGNLAHLENGPHVSAETARRTACDAGIVHMIENQHVDIDADTCASKWYAGDRMNWDLAVANMFH